MSYEPLTPPASLPNGVVNTLNSFDLDCLRDIVRYAAELADHKERETRLEEDATTDDIEKRPDDVPTKATITIKEINGLIESL